MKDVVCLLFMTEALITYLQYQPAVLNPPLAFTWPKTHNIFCVRDVDLDVLEKVVSIIAFGDIEAEDTRHLTELNFLKVNALGKLSLGGSITWTTGLHAPR
eukprot:1159300-Pelagomonas_calceolata.AAC.6